jgi:hypothetical protein
MLNREILLKRNRNNLALIYLEMRLEEREEREEREEVESKLLIVWPQQKT